MKSLKRHLSIKSKYQHKNTLLIINALILYFYNITQIIVKLLNKSTM